MKDTFLSARLVEPNLIRLMLFTSSYSEKANVVFLIDHKESLTLVPSRRSSMNGVTILDFKLEKNLELGHDYCLYLSRFGGMPLDVSEATSFKGFDEAYAYDGSDLGAVYSQKETSFALWAPLASSVVLKYRKNESEPWTLLNMNRGEKGVFRVSVKGDLDLYQYLYVVTNSGVSRESSDPYAKCSGLNGEYSIVADFSKLELPLKNECLSKGIDISNAIIYEGHVRDLTISPFTDIEHKGTFLGLIEKGRKTKGGHPAGFDYLKSLGFTHLQLLPLADYKSVDEKDPDKKYNWGYDPAQYFVPEGSFASIKEDPLSRIKDLKAMVASFHEADIRIVMDVVYNHVYEYETSVFERVVPNYYFRTKADGKMSNCSGCGNDLASERPMVRKLIVDSAEWWIKTYGIDGFRFDLMGLIDVETLKEVEKVAKRYKKDFLLYGEGWNMASAKVPLGTMDNASLLPSFSFFNDTFRESAKSYWAGELSSQQHFKAAMSSMCLDFILPKKFLFAKQSLQYVECHDNQTYYDHLTKHYPDMGEVEKMERCRGALASVLLSFGVPFIHAGEEILLSKGGLDNTYNAGDKANRFPYELLDENYALSEYFSKLIRFRKIIASFSLCEPKKLDVSIDILDEGSAVRIDFLDESGTSPYKDVTACFNPSDSDISLSFAQERSVLFGQNGEAISHKRTLWNLPPRSVMIFGNK
ncbi:MAG: type I pullulanase [Bacilli bacterium]|nr:type I pullulanase [Bacilli bacterium]